MRRLEDICTVEFLRECFNYDPVTGKLWWKEDRPLEHFKSYAGYKAWKSNASGKEADSYARNGSTGYLLIKIKGIRTTAHKIIFTIVNGYFIDIIDHIDGDGTNNKIENLRESCLKSNPKNQKLHKCNTTGISGVTWSIQNNKWRVTNSLTIDGKRISLPITHHDDFFEACCVRISWMNRNGYTRR